jgi:hypothetical protein
MIQPLHEVLPGDRQLDDCAFAVIVSAPELRSIGSDRREGARRDIRRIASALMCSSAVDPSLVSFAKQRTAEHWAISEDEIDLQITIGLIAKAARLMADQHVLAAHRLADLPGAA